MMSSELMLNLRRPLMLLSWVLLPCLVSACSDSLSGPESRRVASIEVTGPGSIEVGNPTPLTAVARNPAGIPLDLRFEWRSTDERIAMVDSAGMVTGTGAGIVVILAIAGDRQGGLRMAVQSRPRTLEIISGDEQEAQAGSLLAEPLVVRVTDAIGAGIANVPVTWSVTAGEAALDDRWVSCQVAASPEPVQAVTAATDADGFASISLVPTVFAEVVVEARASYLDPVSFQLDASDPGATLAIVSGANQELMAGPLLIGGEPMVVRVTNGAGEPIDRVSVEWTVPTGHGAVFTFSPCQEGGFFSRTGSAWGPGTAYVDFLPRVFGTSIVRAAVPGIATSPQIFTVNATAVQVHLMAEPWGGSGGFFAGPDWISDIYVPIGGTVEFWNRLPEAHIRSISLPPGGASFDSGMLAGSATFRFTPNATGVWQYRDEVTGATGTIWTVVAIVLVYDPWSEETVFGVPGAVITTGMALEFVNREPAARIVSTATPSGGASFDSGPLAENETFVFVPSVRGTWSFIDQVSGATGSFTVR